VKHDKNVFSCRRKEETDGADCTSSGRVFQLPLADLRYWVLCVKKCLLTAKEPSLWQKKCSLYIPSYCKLNDAHRWITPAENRQDGGGRKVWSKKCAKRPCFANSHL